MYKPEDDDANAGMELTAHLQNLVDVFGSAEELSEATINSKSASDFDKAVSKKKQEKLNQ
ncbi:MAG: hypothetical protein FWB88_09350 [Defluviitaleaceae bacterium]|nr:hypothetical protein [Defluviitaleaceae bacterium]MCL2239994.1 hypothetical protein [Defluviitaleaceae bacterium]